MRQLARLSLLFPICGCSLIYNPSNIASQQDDARVPDGAPDAKQFHDAEIILDANFSAPTITSVTPTTIDEGIGDAGGPGIVLYIVGGDIANDAVITLVPSEGFDAGVVSGCTAGSGTVAADFEAIAVVVTCPVDSNLAEGSSVAFDLQLSQSEAATPAVLAAGITVIGHDELIGSGSATVVSGTVYSQVNFAGTITAASNAQPLVIKSTSSMTITAVDASATTTTAGPGGFGAGAGPGAATSGTGGGAGFATNGGASGGSGGSAVGDVSLSTFMSPNRASGGGAGTSSGVGASTGAGGAGAGSVELVANAQLQVGSVTAVGGGGGASTAGLLGAAVSGGGGAGGVALLRSATQVASNATITVAGGAGGTGGTAGGSGSPGRLRWDSPVATTFTNVTANASQYAGPEFVRTGPNAAQPITQNPMPMLSLTGEPHSNFNVTVTDPLGNQTNVTGLTFGSGGTAEVQLPALGRGTNQVCALVDSAPLDASELESSNCVDITWVFPGP